MTIEVHPNPSADSVAGFLGIETDELDARDRFQQPINRWLALDGRIPVGLATAFTRPDNRLFLTHRLSSEIAFAPLLDAATEDLPRPIYLSARDDQPARLRSGARAGFVPDLHAVEFDVPFQPALQLTTGRRSKRTDTVRADQVPPDDLFTLDTALRRDVPGNDGWQGNRTWFDDEMTSAEFDPAAYLIARDKDSGELVGLARFWQNQDGPTLGMIGVRPSYRTGRVALGLLHDTMLAASTWGSDTFTTHTAHTSLQRRLRAVGATEAGGFTRLRLAD